MSRKSPKSLPKPGNLYQLKTGGVALVVKVEEAGWGGAWDDESSVFRVWRVTVVDDGGVLSFLWDETYAPYWKLACALKRPETLTSAAE